MKILKFIYRKLLAPSSLYTVVICSMLLLIASASNNIIPAIKASVFGAIFAYCLFFSLTNLIFNIKKINVVLKYLIHFLINAAVFTLIPGYVAEISTGTPRIYYGIIYIAVYVITALIVSLILHFVRKKPKESESQYKSQF